MRQQYKDIKVMGLNSTTSRTEFTLGENVSSLTNEETFLQYIVKVLLTSKGSNGYNLSIGTFLNSFITKGYTPEGIEDAKTEIALAIKQAAEMIKIEQARIPSLPLSQHLKDLEVLKIEFRKESQSWYIYLMVISKNNMRYNVTI
jgi:hypothetical protein